MANVGAELVKMEKENAACSQFDEQCGASDKRRKVMLKRRKMSTTLTNRSRRQEARQGKTCPPGSAKMARTERNVAKQIILDCCRSCSLRNWELITKMSCSRQMMVEKKISKSKACCKCRKRHKTKKTLKEVNKAAKRISKQPEVTDSSTETSGA